MELQEIKKIYQSEYRHIKRGFNKEECELIAFGLSTMLTATHNIPLETICRWENEVDHEEA